MESSRRLPCSVLSLAMAFPEGKPGAWALGQFRGVWQGQVLTHGHLWTPASSLLMRSPRGTEQRGRANPGPWTGNGVAPTPCLQGGVAEGGELARVLASEVGVLGEDQCPLSHRALRVFLGLGSAQESAGTFPPWRIAWHMQCGECGAFPQAASGPYRG